MLADGTAAITMMMAALGDRLGLFRALAGGGPATPAQLADRAGIAERYAREWLAALAAARARTLHHSHLDGPPPEVRQFAARAVRLARSGGDPGTVAACLLALHDAHWRPGSARDRLPIVDEMAGYAERGDENDKARKTVTARIRYTIGRIRRVHPALAAHLDAHVHTGLECEYRPDRPVSWQL